MAHEELINKVEDLHLNGRGTAVRQFLFFVEGQGETSMSRKVGYGYLAVSGGIRLDEEQLLETITSALNRNRSDELITV